MRSRSPPPGIVALESTLRFNNANASALNRTETLQQVTANIACALRLPFESIQIKNITQRMGVNGSVVVVPFDPALLSLASNGEVICFVLPSSTPGLPQRFRRALSATDSSIDVNYVIVDPTPELLTMSPGEFVSAMTADPAIVSLAATLESSGVVSDAPPELALASAADPSTAPATITSTTDSGKVGVAVIAGAIVGAGVVSGVVATVLFFLLNKRAHAATPASQTQPKTFRSLSSAVVVVQQQSQDPIMAKNPLASAAIRATFDPQNIRAGTRV